MGSAEVSRKLFFLLITAAFLIGCQTLLPAKGNMQRQALEFTVENINPHIRTIGETPVNIPGACKGGGAPATQLWDIPPFAFLKAFTVATEYFLFINKEVYDKLPERFLNGIYKVWEEEKESLKRRNTMEGKMSLSKKR